LLTDLRKVWKGDNMWQVVYIAGSEDEAEEILMNMEKEGFMVEIESEGSSCFQIKVPAGEAEDAYTYLNDIY